MLLRRKSPDGAGAEARGKPRASLPWIAAFAAAALLPLLAAFCGPAGGAAVRTAPPPPVAAATSDEAFLADVQERTFRWFWDLADPGTFLIPDRAPTPSFSSVAAVGFGLTACVVGAERGWVPRAEAAERAAKTLRFLITAPEGPEPAGRTRYRGFYYHFLDMKTGARFEKVELSTIDTTLLVAGALTAAMYFDRDDPVEAAIRADADAMYRAIDWNWASPRPPGVSMGWVPEEGFHGYNWSGYDEAMILYLLALGSPTHPIPESAWDTWTATYRWGTFYGQEHVNFSPMFGHQYSHVWVDFRGIRDRYMREKGIDYFENSRRATLSQRAYAEDNPGAWEGYGSGVWGLTACDGPFDGKLVIRGREREFRGYAARGASIAHVIDDGTLAPTAAAGSIPFAPEIAIPALREMQRRWGTHVYNEYGFVDAFNPTLGAADVSLKSGPIVPGVAWFDRDQLGIDQGPIVAMIENHRSGLIWRLMRKNSYLLTGLRRAGFTGGWLDQAAAH